VARIDLAIYTEDPDQAAVLRAYWTLADDGETWEQTVVAIREKWNLKQQEMTQIVQSCGTAHLPEVTCPQCGDARWAGSRKHFGELIRQGNTLCNSCRAVAQVEREKAAKEAAAKRRTEILEAFPVYCDGDLSPGDLSLFDAVALHALFSDPAVEDAGMTTPTSIWPKERRWAPGSVRNDFERRLIRSEPGTIRAHPDSHADAFEWKEEALTGSFYLGHVSYYLLGAGDELSGRPPQLLNALNRVFREGPWPEAWLSQWRDLWEELALADAQAYLDMKLGEHNLEMKQGDGTRTALADALATFSLGQVFNFIYRATKDSAAYYQRGGVNKRQAANSTVGRISAAADRARANGWEVKSFGRPWNLPLSAIGEVLFSKVMWQADMMQVAINAASPPLHAWPEKHSDEPEGDQV
jgi:ribosomal protein L32